MIAVLDASAAIELVLKRPLQSYVGLEVERAAAVLAPDFYVAEVANVFWKYSKLAKDSATVDPRLLDAAIGLVDEYVSTQELYRESYAFSCQWDHPVYDCIYLILARRNDALLVTVDKRMRELAQKNRLRTIALK